MRTLGIGSQFAFTGAEVRLHVTLADQSCTHNFGPEAVEEYGSLTWEADFLGGLAQPVTFSPTLVLSLDYIKAMLPQLVGASMRVQVRAGSADFSPYVGVVRGYTRTGAVGIELEVADKLFDSNPLVPTVAITDSFATPHLEHLVDGQHAFYGNVSSRGLYFTAVTSNAGLFLGPANVPLSVHSALSANLSRVAFTGGTLGDSFSFIPFSLGWVAQSGGTNLFLAGSEGLVVTDVSTTSTTQLTAQVGTKLRYYNLEQVDGIQQDSLTNLTNRGAQIGANIANVGSSVLFRLNFADDVISMRSLWVTVGSLNVFTRSGTIYYSDGVNSLVSLVGLGGARELDTSPFLTDATVKSTVGFYWQNSNSEAIGIRYSPHLVLRSSMYKRSSVLFFPNSTAAVAISTNPFAILDHVNSFGPQIAWNAAQSSACQVLVSSYAFNGYVGPERIPYTDLIDEFGRITGTTIWAGDSGALHFRTYVVSAIAQNSINFTIPAELMEFDSFRISAAPVGSSRFESEKANKITLRYGYVHHLNEYTSTMRAVYSLGGVNAEREFSSQWVIDTLTASLWLNNLRMKYATGKEIYSFNLPMQFAGLELADTLRVQHPMIVGSETFAWVKRLSLDLDHFAIGVDAVKLVGET